MGLHRRRSLRSFRAGAAALIGFAACAGLVSAPSFVGALPDRAAVRVKPRKVVLFAEPTDLDGVAVDGDLQPLADYLLLKPKEAATSTESGLLLANTAKEKPTEGEVVAVGPGGVDKDTGAETPVWAEVGATVWYSKYGSEKVKVGGEEHVLVRDEDVLLSYSGKEASLDNVKLPRGKVLVELQEQETETASGLLIAKAATKSDTTMGKVVSVGGAMLHPKLGEVALDVNIGDTVKFRWGNEVKLDIGKTEYRVVDSSDCLAKWKA